MRRYIEPRKLASIHDRLARLGYTHSSIVAAIEHRDVRLFRWARRRRQVRRCR